MESTPLRDQLALERTRLANERTLLAYLRTALALMAGGAALLHFYPDERGVVLFGSALLALGMAALLLGGVRFTRTNRRLKS